MSKIIYDEIDDRNHNLLFNLNQLNASTGNDKVLPVRCLCCGKIFLISRKDYIDFTCGSNNLKYCSRHCASLAQRKRVTKPCLNCGKMVTKTEKEAEKHPNFFCCKSCAASYNNKRRAPRSKESRLKTSLSVAKTRTKINYKQHSYYKRGEHSTWNGKVVTYNSSYELDYCRLLDSLQIDYQMESLYIEYFNTHKNRLAHAIPDFYLPDSNTIVEIKGAYTYDQQEMKDRMLAYKKLGYNFKLVLEHKEYDYCPPNILEEVLIN